jgi:hypothetical protein
MRLHESKTFRTIGKNCFCATSAENCFKKETLYYVKNGQPVFDIENDWAILQEQ